MEAAPSKNAWLLMAAGEDRGHGGNAGYDDQVDAYYSWDSNVPNSRRIQVGDAVAIWNKQVLHGVSVVERIDITRGPKILNRCPRCSTTRISLRKTRSPSYRCMQQQCHLEFDDPLIDVHEVQMYRARYDAAWTSFNTPLSGADVRRLSLHAGDFNAMRPLDWVRFGDFLTEKRQERALGRLVSRMDIQYYERSIEMATGGFTRTLARVRRGQENFRNHLLETQGRKCAFTGAAPERALEAGHLYSYGKVGSHFAHGGLMLRRDIHALFDDGQLAVEPSTLQIDVEPGLAVYSQYERLHGTPLKLVLHGEQVHWLKIHWNEHRAENPAEYPWLRSPTYRRASAAKSSESL